MKNRMALMVLGLVFSASSVFAAHLAHPDHALLELSTKGLAGPSALSSGVIWVFESGKVYGQSCHPVALPTLPVQHTKFCKTGRFFKTLTVDEVDKVRWLIKETQTGKIVGPKAGEPVCTAIPVESVTYWVTHETATTLYRNYIYTGTEPCGRVFRNDSAAAADLRQMLNELRHEFSAN